MLCVMLALSASKLHLFAMMFNPTEAIGIAAACCTTFAFVPQIIHLLRTKSTDGISLRMYAVFNLGVLLWLVYGLLLHSLPIILANSVTIVLSGTILLMKVRDVIKNRNKKTQKDVQ